ncbi:MAG: type II secretion system protein GspJ [Candidatus Zipacnadales bacterium]
MNRQFGRRGWPIPFSGITLIELLVSIAIGSLVIAAVLGVLTSANRTQRLGESRSDLLQGVRVSLRQIQRDLQLAVTRSNDEDFVLTGTNEVNGDLPFDSLEFTAVSASPLTSLLPTSDLIRVQYLIDVDETTAPEGLTRVALSLPLLDEIPAEQQELSARTYCPRAVGLDFMYYDPTQESWVEEWQERTDMPRAIRVVLYVLPETLEEEVEPDLEDVLAFTTLAHLPLGAMPLGTGQLRLEEEAGSGSPLTGGTGGTGSGRQGAETERLPLQNLGPGSAMGLTLPGAGGSR